MISRAARCLVAITVTGAVAVAGCGGDDSEGSDETSTTAAAVTTSLPSETTADDPSTTTDEAPATTTSMPDAGTDAIAFGEPGADGSVPVTLDPSVWSGLYSGFSDNAGDPLHQLHSEGEDGFYFNVELYTVYGAGWTGETGTFATDCDANGICVYLDSDGTGPAPAVLAGADGEIEIRQIEGGYDMTLSGLTFTGSPTYTIASVDLST